MRFYDYDKSTFCLPRQYTEIILKRPKNKEVEGTRFEIYTFFTPLETRKPKRKTIPIKEAGDLKVSCFCYPDKRGITLKEFAIPKNAS